MSNNTTHINKKLVVLNKPYTFDIARGNVPNHTRFSVFGHNTDVDTNWETIHPLGGLKSYPPDAGGTVYVVSTDSSDSSAGAGARTVILYGQDTKFNAISDTVTLSGATNVKANLASFRRI